MKFSLALGWLSAFSLIFTSLPRMPTEFGLELTDMVSALALSLGLVSRSLNSLN